MIKKNRIAATRSVNIELISLYWNIGEYISRKVKCAEWGQSVVNELAEYIHIMNQNLRGSLTKIYGV
ncbi:DUF1016 N-terminal domain-containing protein [Chitinophaga sp. W2I13]|uniref:DUF1016 N-terminal domain-containing protein n=1 Tax=Chitinophaga sp. W2I13 TaxID=3373923 RepID=UPI003D1FBA50